MTWSNPTFLWLLRAISFCVEVFLHTVFLLYGPRLCCWSPKMGAIQLSLLLTSVLAERYHSECRSFQVSPELPSLSGGLAVIVLQCSMSRDRLSVDLVPLILRLAYGSFPNANRGLDSSCKPHHSCLAPTAASLPHRPRNKASKVSLES